MFDADQPEIAIERFPLTGEGFVGAEALLRRLAREERAPVLRITLIWTVVVGIALWMVSSAVLGASFTSLARGGWSRYVAATSLSVSGVANSVWRSALVALVLMWLVEARTIPDRRGMKVGLAYVGVAGLLVWVVSVFLDGILSAPPGGISGAAANVLQISFFVSAASRAVWTTALAALVLMWLVRSTKPA